MMKRIALLAALMTLFTSVTIAQDPSFEDQPFDYGVRWGFRVSKPGSFLEGYPGKQVQAFVLYKVKTPDTMHTVYGQTLTGTLDDFSYLRFTVGKGDNPLPPGFNPKEFAYITHFCWTVTVTTDDGDKVITGEEEVTSALRANVAALSLNSERFGNNAWSDQSLTVNEFVDLPPDNQRGFTSWYNPTLNERVIQGVDVDNFFTHDKATSIVSGYEVDVLRIGGGNPRRIVFGPATPPVNENIITYCAPSLEDAFHFLGIKIAPHRSPVNHNTAALFLDNTASEQSAGLLSNAQTWGVYGTAQNGVVGITNGPNNGAGITGFVGEAPASGGFKYGIYGTSNSLTASWAAAIFGNGFFTGTWTMSSDARLKTEIRSQSNALEKVMQLKPSQYLYRQDTPYSLPDGLHHGFLAQDVEEIFPELVSDITMPLSLDPQEMYKSGTTEYKGINYIEMIAILTSAMQEMNTTLNAKIDTQAKEIVELRKALQHATPQK